MTHELQKALLQVQNPNNSLNTNLTRYVRVFTLPESAIRQLLRVIAAPKSCAGSARHILTG